MKKLLTWCLVILMALGCSGCDSTPKEPQEEPADEDKTIQVLGIRIGGQPSPYLRDAKNAFESKYRDWEVTFPEYDAQVLSNKIMAGDGPDVYTLEALNYGDYGDSDYRLSIDSLVAQGSLLDFNPYLEEMGIDLNEYLSNLMDAGVFDGKRLFLPATFEIPLLMIPKATEEKYGLTLRDGMSYEEFWEVCKAPREDEVSLFSCRFLFTEYLDAAGIKIVDAQNRLQIRSEEFQKAVEFYKMVYPEMETDEGDSPYYNLCTGRALFEYEYGATESDVLGADNYLMEKTEKGISIYTPPVPEGNRTPVIFAQNGLAVSISSQNRPEVLQYVKEALYQLNLSSGIPYKKYLDMKFKRAQQYIDQNRPNYLIFSSSTYSPVSISIDRVDPDLQAWYISQMNNSKGALKSNSSIKRFVWEELAPYFKGEKDYEACIADLENKLTLYLNE